MLNKRFLFFFRYIRSCYFCLKNSFNAVCMEFYCDSSKNSRQTAIIGKKIKPSVGYFCGNYNRRRINWLRFDSFNQAMLFKIPKIDC